MINTILNLIGWMPLWAILLCGINAYLQLAIRLIKAIKDEYFN